jgi:hypothetical protein
LKIARGVSAEGKALKVAEEATDAAQGAKLTTKEGAQSFTLKEPPKLSKPNPAIMSNKGKGLGWEVPGDIEYLGIPTELTKTTAGQPTKLLRTLRSGDFDPATVNSEAQITKINMLKHEGWKFGTFTSVSPDGEVHFMVDGPYRPIHVESDSPQLVGANKNRFAQRLDDLNTFLKRLYGSNPGFVGEEIAITNHPTGDFALTPEKNNVINLNLVDVLEGRGKDASARLAVERNLLTTGNMAPSRSYYEDTLGISDFDNITMDKKMVRKNFFIDI